MKTLLLDSSNTDLSVGVAVDNKIIYKNSFSAWQRQSEFMISEIEKALKETNLELVDFDEVICGKGPGSFTGVRIALTIAKTICVMSKAKLKLISSLRMFGSLDEKYIAIINARSSRSYVGIFNKKNVEVEDTIYTNEETIKFIKEHPDYKVYGDTKYLGVEGIKPDVIEGMLSIKELVEEEKDVMASKPVYLKD